MRWLCVLLALSACNSAGPHFRGLAATQITVDGSTFDVRVRDELAEAIRINPQYAPRLGLIERRGSQAMAIVSGCEVKEVRGDQAQLLGILKCGSGKRHIDRSRRADELDCLVLDSYVSPATKQVVLDVDCVPI
ncbi:MAG: hypothetical protein AAGG57_01945 [Pseudomonadota bacterium]